MADSSGAKDLFPAFRGAVRHSPIYHVSSGDSCLILSVERAEGREQWNVSVGKHKNSGGVWHGRRNMVEAGGEAPQLRGSGCGRYRRVVGISFSRRET